MGTHRKASKSTQLKKTFAVGAIAGAAAGFGALSLAPTAFADITNEDNEGWWLGSGNLNGNQTIFGNNGNGVVNQFGVANGNIMNNQTNIPLFSPQLNAGTAAQVNTPVQPNTPIAANLQAPIGNGTAISPAAAPNVALGSGLAANLTGANAAAATPINAGANVLPIQAPVQNNLIPIGGTQDNGGNTQVPIGAIQAGENEAEVNDQDDALGISNQEALAIGGDAGDVDQEGTASNNGSINNNNTPNNSAVAANNYANNSSNNNSVNNNGNNSSNSVGNDNENEND